MTAKRIAVLLCSLLVTVALLPSASAAAELPEEWERFMMPSGGSLSTPKMAYWVYAPFDVKPGLPLVVYLHSTHGMNNWALNPAERGLPSLVLDGTVPYPECIILVPQHPGTYDDEWEPVIQSVKRCVEKVIEDYQVDTSRIAVTGYSLGAIGIWDLVNAMPGTFSRLLCVDGRIRKLSQNPELFEGCAVKVYTANHDETVNNVTCYRFVSALNERGMEASVIPLETTHGEIPKLVYGDESVQEWLWIISAVVRDSDPDAAAGSGPDAASDPSLVPASPESPVTVKQLPQALP